MEKKCEHKKWNKWKTIINTALGLELQQRSCKKCGWAETKRTDVFSPSILKKELREVLVEVLTELKVDFTLPEKNLTKCKKGMEK